MRKLIALMIMSVFAFGEADAQGILKRLKDKAVETVTNKAEEKVQKTVSDEMDDVLGNEDESEGKKSKKSKKGGGEEEVESAPATPEAAEATYAKSDFVPGDEVFFADELAGEKLGEFPSQWDLLEGSAEVAVMKGQNCIHFDIDSKIAPLMRDMDNYLPDVFTLEMDVWLNHESTDMANRYYIRTYYLNADGGTEDAYEVCISRSNGQEDLDYTCRYLPSTGNDWRDAGDNTKWDYKKNDWNHIALSFNKRALKLYLNGQRVINIPNCKAATKLSIEQLGWGGYNGDKCYITNVRMAKGAVPLYDRLTSDGKITTYVITFDTGKSTIKPESMVEITRIQKLMTENASLKFEVQGHCDSTGSAATNDKLSQERAEAIVAKLVELGIAKDRLTAVGKGSKEPVADNSTEEGKAKNRRVVFVKK